MKLFETLWRSRPPVSPWWMYGWLRDLEPSRGRWRAALYTLPCWWKLWRWAASPDGYDGDYTDVTFGGKP